MIIRILLADDHPIVREGLRAVLETQPDFEVVGTPQQAANGEEALRLALELAPDILLLDLEMPVMDGVETIRRLHMQFHHGPPNSRQQCPRIIVFTAFDNDERIIAALEAGANGYLLKGAPREEIFNAIRVTMQGGSLLQPVIASKLLRHMGQQRGRSSSEQPVCMKRSLSVKSKCWRCWRRACPTKKSPLILSSANEPPNFMLAPLWANLARPIAPKPSPWPPRRA